MHRPTVGRYPSNNRCNSNGLAVGETTLRLDRRFLRLSHPRSRPIFAYRVGPLRRGLLVQVLAPLSTSPSTCHVASPPVCEHKSVMSELARESSQAGRPETLGPAFCDWTIAAGATAAKGRLVLQLRATVYRKIASSRCRVSSSILGSRCSETSLKISRNSLSFGVIIGSIKSAPSGTWLASQR